MRDNNFSNNAVGSHNNVTVSSAWASAGRTAITMFASVILLGITVAIIYTVVAYAAIVSIVVPLLVGLGALTGIVLTVSTMIRHIAKTRAIVSYYTAQRERNAILDVNENTIIVKDPVTGKLSVHNARAISENYHMSAKPDEIPQVASSRQPRRTQSLADLLRGD